MLGDDARAEEFFQIARTTLEDLLETDDYAIAEATFALAYFLYGRVGSHSPPPPQPNTPLFVIMLIDLR